MKIVATLIADEDYFHRYGISMDGESVLEIHDAGDCPEDATLYRDLKCVREIPDLLKRAYEAGKNGESFELEQIEEKEYEIGGVTLSRKA